MIEISKGKQVNVKTIFKRRGQICTFINPPTWVVYNEKGKAILSGTALNKGSKWVASFTVATSYVVPNGKEELMVEFSGYDQNNNSHVRTVDVLLIDESEDYKPVGIIYSLIDSAKLRDTLELEYDSIDQLDWRILPPTSDATPVARGKLTGPLMSDSANSKGFLYKVNLGRPDITHVYNDPYLVVLEATVAGEEDPITEVHPMYLLTPKTSTLATQLQAYLDKARLFEIDPTLQWHVPEYLHFTLEGMKHINSAPSEPSFWTVDDLPSLLRQCLFSASALYALNARYFAEGFNSFEFSGLNTNANFNRLETITYKIEELKAYLEANLEKAKKAAISANGPGVPTDGETDTRMLRVGSLGLHSSPVSNYVTRFRHRRFRR